MKRTLLLALVLFLLVTTLIVTASCSCGGESPAVTTAGDSTSSLSTSSVKPEDSTPNTTATTTKPQTTTTTAPNTTTIPNPYPEAEKLLTGDVALVFPVLVVDETAEYSSVLRAVSDLQNDFKAVTGNSPAIKAAPDSSATSIIIGTIGKSALIDKMVAGGTIDVSAVKGKWEGFHLGVYSGISGKEKTIVIAGADMRGTIFGIYTLSELIGVSPWHWWADVPTVKNTSLSLTAEVLTKDDAPDVKYRGIFINDEEASAVWGKMYENTTDSQGSPNPFIYGKMFELLLRLKANTLWPAMHATSDAFNAIVNPETGVSYNAELANEYGIVMGASHCEMLLCNNETEWVPWCEANVGKYNLRKLNNNWKDSYDYTVNAEAMNAYWEDRVAANYRFENIYTIGLRGVHDSEILCSALSDKSWASKAEVVRAAIEAQIAILEKYEDIYEQETGTRREFATCFCPYKEAAEYYKYDLSLPSDCIILFADDNYGYVRQYPTNTELETYAGCGVYYHVSYRGVPRSYLWIDSAPLSLIYEEMHKSFAAGSDDMWILNVGDLKPAEFSTNFFLDLAWDEDSITKDTLEDWMKAFFKETFALSDKDAESLSALHSSFLQTAYAYRADFQGYNEGNEYAINAFGDEAQRVIDKMEKILANATAIYDSLDAAYKDAYYEIVLYRIRATLFTLQKNIYAQKNALAIAQGKFASVNGYAALAEEAYQNILKDLNTYNALQNGKWKGIMDPYITDNGSPVITGAPKVTYLSSDLAADGVGAAIEGQTSASPITVTFDSIDDTEKFIDVFSKGIKAYNFKITTTNAVEITLADGKALTFTDNCTTRTYTGKVDVETRFFITIDWDKVQTGKSTVTLTISDDHGTNLTYTLSLNKKSVDPAKETEKGYYEANGYISIEAEHYTNNVEVNDMKWQLVPNLGVSGHSMKAYPDHSADFQRIEIAYETESPYLEYKFYVETTGTYHGGFFRIPTMNEGETDDFIHKTCRTGWSLDGGTVDYFRGTSYVDTGTGSAWSDGVRYNYELKTFTITVSEPGWHTLRIYLVDAGAAFDKIVLRHESTPDTPSRLGCPETFNTISYEKVARATPRTFSLNKITFKDGEREPILFDFTTNTSNAQGGYTGVDLSASSVPTKRYAWTEGFEAIKATLRNSSNISLRDGGYFYSDAPATFTVTLAKAGKYIVAISVGDRQSGGFAVPDMSVSVGETVYLTGINQAPGGTSEYAFVIETADATLPLRFEGKWAVSSVEIRPYTETQAPTGPATQNGDGDVILEAEWALENSDNFKNTASTDGNNYHFMQTAGESGAAVYFGPNRENSFPSTDVNGSQSAKLYYNFTLKAGTYSVFAFVKCEEDNDDSVIMAVNGAQVQVANDFKLTGGEYKAFRIGSITIAQDGTYTLQILGREDGLAIDRFVITTKSIWTE